MAALQWPLSKQTSSGMTDRGVILTQLLQKQSSEAQLSFNDSNSVFTKIR
jgi:hypothetical protein